MQDKPKVTSSVMYLNHDVREQARSVALKLLEDFKKREKKLQEEGKFTTIHIPLGNAIIKTTSPDEFNLKIKNDDFFTL